MSLREKQLHERRTRILDTAERVIRETGGTEFSMRALAAASETSPATPYNLFGSKDGLLYALLSRSLDQITALGLSFRSPDPFDHVLEAADNAVDIFVKDPGYLRPLYQFLLGVVHPVYRPQFIERSLAYWREALSAVDEAGLLEDSFDRPMLARVLMAHFMGVLDFWIHEDVDDAGFRAYVAYGTALQLLPLARDGHAISVQQQLRTARKRISDLVEDGSPRLVTMPYASTQTMSRHS